MGYSEPMTLKAKPLYVSVYRKHLWIALLQPTKRSTMHSYLIKNCTKVYAYPLQHGSCSPKILRLFTETSFGHCMLQQKQTMQEV